MPIRLEDKQSGVLDGDDFTAIPVKPARKSTNLQGISPHPIDAKIIETNPKGINVNENANERKKSESSKTPVHHDSTKARLLPKERSSELLKRKLQSPFMTEGNKMPRRIFNGLNEAKATECWGLMKHEVCRNLLGEDFIPNPRVEESKSFYLASVYYKPRKACMKSTNYYYLDKLPKLIDNRNSSTVPIDHHTIVTKLINNKHLDQNYFWRVADVKDGQLKSCEVQIKGCSYQTLDTDLIKNAYYFDMKGQRLENMKKCYVVTEVIVADEVFLKTMVQPVIQVASWYNVVVAFRYKKYEIDEKGRIVVQLKSSTKKSAKNIHWHAKVHQMTDYEFEPKCSANVVAHPLQKEFEIRQKRLF